MSLRDSPPKKTHTHKNTNETNNHYNCNYTHTRMYLVERALEGVEGVKHPLALAVFEPQQLQAVAGPPEEGARAEAARGGVLCFVGC